MNRRLPSDPLFSCCCRDFFLCIQTKVIKDEKRGVFSSWIYVVFTKYTTSISLWFLTIILATSIASIFSLRCLKILVFPVKNSGEKYSVFFANLRSFVYFSTICSGPKSKSITICQYCTFATKTRFSLQNVFHIFISRLYNQNFFENENQIILENEK